jgi:hypothetical protein
VGLPLAELVVLARRIDVELVGAPP